jgi:hypothetical protein
MLALLVAGCGYRALNATDAGEKLHVSLVRVAIPSGAAGQEVLTGAREELAKLGALASGDGYPRLEIEVTGASETSEGIEVPPGVRHERGPDDITRTPIARGLDVAVVAHAWVVRQKDGPRERDTGDLRASDLVSAGGPDPITSDFVHEDSVRAVARRLGHKLAARAVGDPTVSEGLGR